MSLAARTASRPSLGRSIRDFFYAEEVPYGLALVRIVFPLILFAVMLARWPHARELYSADGAPSQLSFSYGWGNLLPELPGGVAVALLTALLFFLVTSSLGWYTRFSLVASTILYTYFNMLDAMSTITKYSVIAVHVLLLLSVSQCGAIWSLDRWQRRTRRRSQDGTFAAELPRSPVWPRRLMQLLIGFVYFGAAITKMHTPEYFSGDQLVFWMATHANYEHRLGEWLTLYPALLVTFAYIAVVWEVLFVFLVWRGWGRVCMLGLGALFHLMTLFTLGLHFFPMICWTIYFAFLEEDDARRIAWHCRRLFHRIGWWPSRRIPRTAGDRPLSPPFRLPYPAAVFSMLVVGLGLVGVEVEYRLDPYAIRGPEGPLPLRTIDPKIATAMLEQSEPLRLKDKFFAFELGTTLIGPNLINRRDEFRHGETAIAQCSLNPPHDDLWVECNLYDSENRLLDRVGAIISREMTRCNYFYQFSEALEPGEYFLVLESAGDEITRRKITLHPRSGRPVAN